MEKEIHHSDRAFLDLMFLSLLGFVFLFFVSFLMITIEKQKANITTKAEYIITLTWDVDNKDDVDIWLRDPVGNLIFFREKEKGLMHLDRDDLGTKKDKYTLPDGTSILYPYNQEIITIRGFIPGTWILNMHMYNKRERELTNVEVKMEKLNPSVKTIFIKRYSIKTGGREITVSRFEMSGAGTIISMDEVFIGLVSEEIMLRALSGPS